MKNIQSEKIKDLFAYLIITLLAAILLWRAKYGFIWSDEPYYFETAYRFLQGDKPIVNDWYTAQIYSVLLVPYMKLWKMVVGTGFTGIFLFSRYLYVIIQLIIGLICYRTFRKKSRIAAITSSVIFMMYCRGNIATISYYSVCSASLFLALIMTYYSLTNTNSFNVYASKGKLGSFWLMIGVLWGIAIICNPYLFLLYIVWFAVLFIRIIRERKAQFVLLYTLLGTVAIGFPFASFILHDVELSEIVNGISYVMSDDSYFGSTSMGYKLLSGFLYIANRFRYTIVISFISMVYLLIKNVKKLRNRLQSAHIDKNQKLFLVCLNSAILLIDVVYPVHTAYTAGSCMAAIAIWGFQMYLLSDKKDISIFAMLYVPGVVAALLMSSSGDTHFSATTQGMMIAATASVFFGMSAIHELKNHLYGIESKKRNFLYLACGIIYFIVFMTAFYDRIVLVYRDKPITYLTTSISEGPAKGISTTEECLRRYNAITETVDKLATIDGNLYIMNFCPWAYLLTDMKCSPYTAWRIMPDTDDNLGQQYYELHPDKFPDIVLRLSFDNIEYDEKTSNFGENNTMGDNNSRLDYAWNHSKLVNELKDRHYRTVNVPCGKLYVNNSGEYKWISEELFD